MRCIGVLVGALLFAAAPSHAVAQGSGGEGGGQTVNSRIEMSYSHSYRDSSGVSTSWMKYVVLWRGQPGWQSVSADAATRAEADRAYKEARMAAIAAERSIMGGGGVIKYLAETDRMGRKLFVLGQEFAIPQRDSALVVLIDRIDNVGGPPVVVAAAVLDGRLPAGVRQKTWTSGDTTFIVRPAKSATEAFLSALKSDPIVAAFLSDGAP